MFYSNFVFTKKGPLAKVWLAAHQADRKLTKSFVLDTNIEDSAKRILKPTAPLAIRLSAQLMYGLTRIYCKKVQYLQEDASEALTKIKISIRAVRVDLPPEATTAKQQEITMPENADQLSLDIDILNPGDFAGDGDMIEFTQLTQSQKPSQSLAKESEITMAPQELFNQRELDDLGFGGLDDSSFANIDANMVFGADESMVSIEVQRDADERPKTPTTPSRRSDASRDGALLVDDELKEAREKDVSRASVSIPDMGDMIDMPEVDLGEIQQQQGEDEEKAPKEKEKQKAAKQKAAEAAAVAAVAEADAEPEPATQRRKRKKPMMEKPDRVTELSNEALKQALQDPSELVLEQRPALPLTKRQRTALHYRATAADLSSAVLFDDELTLAPELQQVFERASSLVGKATATAKDKDQDKDEKREEKDKRAAAKKDKQQEKEKEKEQDDDVKSHVSDVEQKRAAAAAGQADELGVSMGGDFDMSHDASMMDMGHDLDASSVSQIQVPPMEDAPSPVKELSLADMQDDLLGEDEHHRDKRKRSHKLLQLMSHKLSEKGVERMTLDDLVEGRNRKTAAGAFFTLLVLSTHGEVEVSQKKAYGSIDITITRTGQAAVEAQ